jgi:uncharacterized membrane protein YphA (DoxX/SURF4 family)
VAAVACRVLVGLVLLVSGTLKLRQPAWPATAAAFGTPGPLIPTLPWVELLLGATMVAQLGGRWTALAALGLLLAFTAAIAAQVARGRRVPCACFGEASQDPVGPATLARNMALCALALVAVVGAR